MRLLWISGIDGFCHRYEVLHRVAQAQLLGARSTVRHFNDDRLVHDVERADLVVAYRTPDTLLIRAVIARSRARRVPVLGTIDDLIFLPEESALPAQADTWTTGERAAWIDGVRRYRAVLESCDGFIAPTEPLRDAASMLGWRTWLHRDSLSAAELDRGAAARLAATRDRDRRLGAPVVLGYFSGTPTHDRDFAAIAPVVADVLARHPHCELLVVGPLELDPVLAPFASRVRRSPLVPWTELPARIAAVDICLAPLEPGRAFTDAKGEVKYLEAAAVGVPTIASPTAAFRHAIAHRQTGMLAAGDVAWRSALDELIASPDRRHALGQAARLDVEARFSPDVRARELREILRDACALPSQDGDNGRSRPHERSHDVTFPSRVALEADARPLLTHAPRDAVTPPLVAGALLVQELTLPAEPPGRIDLCTVTYGQRIEAHFTLRLRDGRGRVVLQRRRRVASAPDRSWWSFALPRRLCDAVRLRLELSCDAPPGTATLSLALAAPAREGPSGESRPQAAQLAGRELEAPLALRVFARGNDVLALRAVVDRASTLIGALQGVAAEEGGVSRVVFAARDGSERRTSLAALLERGRRIAAALEAHGVGTGDGVVLVLPTGPELVASYLAVMLLGAVPALASTPTQRVTDPAAYRALLGGIITDAQARLILCDARTAGIVGGADDATFCGARIVTDLRPRHGRFAGLVPDDPDTIATIQYSSGSTGRPKGARLGHRAILNNVRAVRDALAIGPEDVSVNWIPLYHDMGLIDALLVPLLSGCETILLSTADFVREPRCWLEALTRYRGTMSWAPNFAYALCVQRADPHAGAPLDLSRWRLAINAAEPVLPETVADFAERFAEVGFRRDAMTPAWGLAENVTIATVHPPAAAPRLEYIDRLAASDGHARPALDAVSAFGCVAVGRPLPGCAVEIRDGTRAVGERVIGDVWLASNSLFTGYGPSDGDAADDARDHGATRWLPTGDRGYVADGDLFFVARARDVIVIAGAKHAPHDVESAICAVPGVRAGCAVAFGVRDVVRGTEALAAVVETRVEDPEALAALARAIQARVSRVTGLALRHLKLVPPGGVRKTTSGKLARAATRALHERELA